MRDACCTYKYIDIGNLVGCSVFAVTRPCALNETRPRTGQTFASMMFALKLPFSFSTIRPPLHNATAPIRVISARAAKFHERRAYEEAHKGAEARHPSHRRKKRRRH